MPLPRLYLETTIPSYLTARPNRNQRIAHIHRVTDEWWRTQRHKYELFTSGVVVEEVGKGDEVMAAARLKLLAGIPRLPADPQVDELIDDLLESGVIPEVAAPDAAHIALSCVHEMQFLLTWNCKHIRNPHSIPRIERACTQRGLTCPMICTPEELLAR